MTGKIVQKYKNCLNFFGNFEKRKKRCCEYEKRDTEKTF